MKRSNKNTLLFIGASLALTLGVVGSVTGTYAWYQYATRAGFGYYGTAVGKADSLFIGLVSEKKLEGFATEHTLSEDTTSLSGKTIYWVKNGEGLRSEVILDFEQRLGYAGNEISATSSGSFSSGDKLVVKNSPNYLARTEYYEAPKSLYTYLPFAFKVNGNESGGLPVTLTNAEVKCKNDVAHAVRIGFTDPNASNGSLLLCPKSKGEGYTEVGGILNLNAAKDDLYDYSPASEVEQVYGEYDDYKVLPEVYDGSIDFPKDKITTFDSNHKKGLRKISYKPKKAEYCGYDDVLNAKTLSRSVAGSGIAQLNVAIFLEGWDRTVVDSAVSSVYDLQLQFTMSDGQ